MSENLPSLIDTGDFDRYEALLAQFLAGRLAEPAFVAERLLLGIYGQRQAGYCMVRTKVPGGRLPAAHLAGYADCLERFSKHPVVHLTTRQNIQFHYVPLAQTGALQRALGGYGILTREAGGNTVRNVTACPLAGICPSEQVDVGGHAAGVARWFLRNPLTQSLPRKFKIALSGCAADCAQAAANDLGIIATSRDDRRGFRLLVGGGLGAHPHAPVVLEEFVEEADLLPALEAVVVLHDRHSDRTRKGRSRIKFLVERLGVEALREHYRRERLRTRAAFDGTRAPRGSWRRAPVDPLHRPDAPRAPFAQPQAGRLALPLQVSRGDLTAAQLRALARLLAAEGLGELRITPDQNLIVPHVPEARATPLLAALAAEGLAPPRVGENIAACPGTLTCPLGLTASPGVAALVSGGACDLRIRVNGCQNSCAHSDLADIGLYGKARRHFGRLVPTYALQLGGGDGRFGSEGPELPAARVPEAVRRLHDAFAESGMTRFRDFCDARGAAWFGELLADLTEVSESAIDQLVTDHGESSLFRVSASGVGECAGVQLDPAAKLRLDLDYEQRLCDAFLARRKFDEAIESLEAMLAIGARLALLAAGEREGGAGDPFAPLRLRRPEEAAQLERLLAALRQWREAPDELLLPPLVRAAKEWLDAARAPQAPSPRCAGESPRSPAASL